MKALFLIPARGGSKGVHKKNIKKLKGKPLICYTIDAARSVTDSSNICVSSDDDEIIKVVEDYGLTVPFKRPDHLSSDNAGMYDVLIHALDYYSEKGIKYDCLVLLQPTSPLRTGKHISEALQLFSRDIDMVVSVKKTDSNPYYVLFEENSAGYLKKSHEGDFIRRQDCPDVWELNGAIYVINVASLRKNDNLSFRKMKKYVMDKISSIDIDESLDWEICEMILNKGMSYEKNH